MDAMLTIMRPIRQPDQGPNGPNMRAPALQPRAPCTDVRRGRHAKYAPKFPPRSPPQFTPLQFSAVITTNSLGVS